ncbi:MAG TPA: excisionase family DNA-binding protein [Bacteroidales bacterium]|nr:excisionase family DNA-binding protein [Bacteroidales bacterium]
MDNPKEKRIFMTIKEASEYMKLAPNTLYHKIHDKNNPIPHLKVGSRVLFDMEQVNRWMGIGTQKPQAKSTIQKETPKLRLSDFYGEENYKGRRTMARKKTSTHFSSDLSH